MPRDFLLVFLYRKRIMKSSDKIYLILNNDETQYQNKRQESMIYKQLERFIEQARYVDCKVAVYELKEIVPMNILKKRI